jgi:AcrR family transcriptional regulator
MDAASPVLPDWRKFSDSLGLNPVLDAAASAFIVSGYHGTTMRDIARRADLSVPGLYHHYPSKQHMLCAVLAAATGELGWRMEAAEQEAGPDPVRRLELLVTALVLYHGYRAGLGQVALGELRSLEPENRRRHAHALAGLRGRLDAAVRDGVSQGRFRTAHPADAARALAGMCQAVASWFRSGLALSPEDVASRYVGFALGLVRARES